MHRRSVQRLQFQALHAWPIKRGQRRQRLGQRRTDVTRGAGAEQPGDRAAVREQRRQHLQRGGIGEVQVVEQQRDRLPCGALVEVANDRRPQVQRLDAPGRGRAPFGQQAGQLGARPGRCGRRVRQRTQQPHQQSVGHVEVPRPGAGKRGKQPGKVAEQPALAQTRFAHDQHGHAVGRGGMQGVPFGLAADQARRPQHRGRQRLPAARRRHRAALDQPGQFAGFLARPGVQFVAQQRHQPAVGIERGGPVTAQVMQAHHAPMCVLLQRVVPQQPLRTGERAADVALLFEPRGDTGQHACAPRPPALALGFDPVRQLKAIAKIEATEQLTFTGQRLGQQLRVGQVQIVLDALGEREHLVAAQQVDAGGAPKPEEPLAQVVACAFGVGVGPDVGGRSRALHRPVKHHEREQRGVTPLQHIRRATRPLEAGHAEQTQPRRAARSGR